MELYDILLAKRLGGGGGGSAVINPLSVSANGTYSAPGGVDGYNPVEVAVPMPSGTYSITNNGIYDIVSYASVDVNVSGGGGLADLLATQSLGHLSTNTGSEEDIAQTLVLDDSDVHFSDYDVLIVACEAEGRENNKHIATENIILLARGTYAQKKGPQLLTWMNEYYTNSSGIINVFGLGISYGVYVSTSTLSSDVITITFRMKYSSDFSKTIDDNYTAKVYGFKLPL